MATSSFDNTIKPAPMAWVCNWIWERRAILFSIDILSAIWAALLVLDVTTTSNLLGLHILAGIQASWPLFLALFIALVLFTIICGLVVRTDLPLSPPPLQLLYLNKLIHDRQMSTLTGIPAGLIVERVHLTDIFIPLQFRPNRPYADYPLSNRELERYQQELKSGIFSHDLQRVVLEAEKHWYTAKPTDRIGIADVWKLLTNSDAVVIQGYPGTGKSTLMERLTLYMALRLSGQPDTDMPGQKSLTPLLLPILLRLGEYARALQHTTNLTLDDYIMQTLAKMGIPDLPAFMQKKLVEGSCLVILDGLDEVSDLVIRKKVQEAIKICIHDHRGEQATSNSTTQQNRFLITSRVAGYDQAAFPDYPHVTITELSAEQIQDFLPRWYRAHLCYDHHISVQEGLHNKDIEREVTQRVQVIQKALNENRAVKELAENPLLLTLLVVMQRNSVVLPEQRVELYDVVTRTLLENRNIAKGIEPVPSHTALRRLGPLAFQMQEENNSFAREHDVMDTLVRAIRDEGGSEEAIRQEAIDFLRRIRERGGLFVQRSGDYFGFMHRTFQEYFAARYILNNINVEEAHWIDELVTRASRLDALWREPFLLAVAYQSNRNEVIANKILSAFLARTPAHPLSQHVTHLLLAANAVTEAKSSTLAPTLEKQIAKQLFAAYERAQREQDFEQCQKIEPVIQRWLLSLPKEGYRLPLLEIISQAVSASQRIAYQRATLTLLAMIADRLQACPSEVFETLIPPLLALTGLPAVKAYHPTSDISPADDADIADLALTVLSFLGKPGPAGLLLTSVKQHFRDQPDHLRILARCSLEAGTLITPIPPPMANANYHSYETAIERWFKLRDRAKQQAKEQDVDECVSIHQALLDCAEEVIYPTSIHLLAMLQNTAKYPDHPWSSIWQNYLQEQLTTGNTISYQELALLWSMLFPDLLQPVVNIILRHFTTIGSQREQYAQRFLSSLSRDWRYWRDWRDWQDWQDLRDWRDWRDWRYWRYLLDLRYLRYLRDWRDWRDWQDLRDWRDWRDLRYLRYLLDLRVLRDLLFTQNIAEHALSLLSSPKAEQRSTGLLILMGYLLHLQDAEKIDNTIAFIEQVSDAALRALKDSDTLVRDSALDLLEILPARTVEEIILVRKIVERIPDQSARETCARSLWYANPVNDQARQELEKGRGSTVLEVREAIERRKK
jgi:hypothetical protein